MEELHDLAGRLALKSEEILHNEIILLVPSEF